MKPIFYTNGVDIINIIHKSKHGLLIKDQNSLMTSLTNLDHFRLIDDQKNIKDWYYDAKAYAKKHPLEAFITAVSIFFGLTNF